MKQLSVFKTPAELNGFLLRTELVSPEEAKQIHLRYTGSRLRRRQWDTLLNEFEQIIGRSV